MFVSNFPEGLCNVMLGSSKLNISWQYFIIDIIRSKQFHKNLLTIKSSDCKSRLGNWQTSRACKSIGREPQNREALGSRHLTVGAGLTPKTNPSPYVLPRQIWYIPATKGVCINRKKPQKLGSAGEPLPCGRSMAEPQEIRSSPHVLSSWI